MILSYDGRIMTKPEWPCNRLKSFRLEQGWSQAELAGRAGISRTAVSAMEGDRLVPSVAAALALARALGTTVETLFAPQDAGDRQVAWAWEPHWEGQPYWQAEVGGRTWLYPAESTPMLTPLPDGPSSSRQTDSHGDKPTASQTLVVACCDPAAGLLASQYAQTSG